MDGSVKVDVLSLEVIVLPIHTVLCGFGVFRVCARTHACVAFIVYLSRMGVGFSAHAPLSMQMFARKSGKWVPKPRPQNVSIFRRTFENNYVGDGGVKDQFSGTPRRVEVKYHFQ